MCACQKNDLTRMSIPIVMVRMCLNAYSGDSFGGKKSAKYYSSAS